MHFVWGTMPALNHHTTASRTKVHIKAMDKSRLCYQILQPWVCTAHGTWTPTWPKEFGHSKPRIGVNISMKLLSSPGFQKGMYDIVLIKTLQPLGACMGCPHSTVMPYMHTDHNLPWQNGRISEGETTGEIISKEFQDRANRMQYYKQYI